MYNNIWLTSVTSGRRVRIRTSRSCDCLWPSAGVSQDRERPAASLRIAAERSVIHSKAVDDPKETVKLNTVGAGIAIGVAIGVGIGVAMDNIGVGIAIGIAIGAAFGASQQKKGD